MAVRLAQNASSVTLGGSRSLALALHQEDEKALFALGIGDTLVSAFFHSKLVSLTSTSSTDSSSLIQKYTPRSFKCCFLCLLRFIFR